MNPSASDQPTGLNSLTPSDEIPLKGTNPLYAALNERRGSIRPQPKNTNLYEVKTADSLAAIAARFHTTPSELTNLNRLSSRTVFPGQIVYIPESSTYLLPQSQFLQKQSVVESDSPKPGHVERVSSVDEQERDSVKRNIHVTPSQLAEVKDKQSTKKFLKINAKHITDGEGVVSGVLLVTSNHLMFDPNVSDPLVIEHGMEKYGVVAPMHMVVKAALYPDIVRMKVKDAPHSSNLGIKKLDIYHSKNLVLKRAHSQEDTDNVPFISRRYSSAFETPGRKNPSPLSEALSEITEFVGTDDDYLDHSSPGPSKVKSEASLELKATGSSSSCDLFESFSENTSSEIFLKEESQVRTSISSVLELESDIEKSTELETSHLQNVDPPGEKTSSEEESGSFPMEENTVKKKNNFERTKQKFQKGLRKLSISDGLFPNSLNQRRMSLPASSTSESKHKSSLFSLNSKKSKSTEEKLKPESSGMSYVNMVDDKPELFPSLEKLIPRPAKSFDETPLYLCLRMGRPVKKALHLRSTPVMDFGRKIKPEYWFSIPQERVDELYVFFLRWTPEKYGDVDDVDFEALGFQSVDEEQDEEVPEPSAEYPPGRRRSSWAFPWKRRKSKDITEITKVEDLSPIDWELLSLEEPQREPSVTESEMSLPELLTSSNILSEEHIRKLNEHLPARAVGYPWSLIYSTALHGFSLKTMYREMTNYDTPVLLVVASSTGAIFGAMLSCPLRISDHFYGTGESFLFTFYPEFKCFHWAGENVYFIKGNNGSFAIGASEGHFGLWLDDDLYHGCTKECQTYANDCLCDQEDFVVQALEAWGFV